MNNLNRRSFLGVGLGRLIATWLPKTPIVPIDLSNFCSSDSRGRWNLTRPFTQLTADFPWRYGTDSRICVRLPESSILSEKPDLTMPPASQLQWTHGDRAGWKSWPVRNYLEASDSTCPACDGEGFVVRNGAASECRRCDGRGHGVFPAIQGIGHGFIDSKYDTLIRRHLGECEYRLQLVKSPLVVDGRPWTHEVVQFRFLGGEGMLCTLPEDDVANRLKRI